MRTMRPGGRTREHQIDWLGAGVLSVGVSAILLACAWAGTDFAWTSPQVLGAFAIGGGQHRRVPGGGAPRAGAAAPAHALPRPHVRRFDAAPRSAIGAVLFGITIYVPVYMQGVLGASATSSGVVLIPLTFGWVAASFTSGQLISRTGRYRIYPLRRIEPRAGRRASCSPCSTRTPHDRLPPPTWS